MSTIDTIDSHSQADTSFRSRVSQPGTGTIGTIVHWLGNAMTKRRTRIHLSELSNDLLKDIGVGPAEARQESKRFFWE